MIRLACFSLFGLGLGLFLHTPNVQAEIQCIEPQDAAGMSKAVVVDPVALAHTAQLLPLDAKGGIVGKGDIARQSEEVLDQLDRTLRMADADLQELVKLNIYVARAELSAAVSGVLARRFPGKVKPAVTFVGGDLVHPDAMVAMDAIAVSKLKTSGHAPVHFKNKEGKGAVVSVLPPTGVVYVAGLADTNSLAPATATTLDKIESAIQHLGLKRKDIVQLKAFLRPMQEAEQVRSAIARYFKDDVVPPVVYVDWISSSVPVEIEAIVGAPAVSSEQLVSFHTPPGIKASPVYSRLAQIHSGRRIYVSGLAGESVPEKDVADIYRQLDRILETTGSNRDQLVKATYYHSDPQSNSRLDAFRPRYYNPKTPPAASKAKAKDVGLPGKGIVIDIIAVAK